MEKVKEKKKMNGFLKFFIVIISIALIILIFLKLLLPDLFSPKDLGVQVNRDAYNRALTKLNYQIGDVPSDLKHDDYNHIYGSVNKISESFTSEEITSFINIDQPKDANIKNVQVLINEDNSLSLSASINVDAVLNAIEYIPIRYRKKENLPVNFIIPDVANIYGKFKGEFKNNKVVNFDIEEFEIMGYDVMIYLEQNHGIEILGAEINDQLNYLNQLTGFYIESGTFKDGNFVFDGNFPSSYTVEKNS